MTDRHHPAVMRHCVRTYLQSVRLRHSTMRALEEEILALRLRLQGLSSPSASERSCSVASGDRMASGLAALEELEDEWARAVASDASFISDAIMLCRREAESWACYLHWASDLTWAQVARTIGYSEPHTKSFIAPAGIKQIYERMPEEYRRYSIPNSI